MRRIVARLLAVIVAAPIIAMASILSAPPAAACTSGAPTFDEAMAGARAIAWVKVVLGPDGEPQPGVSPLRVTEVILGDPQPFLANDPRTSLCGDTIHYLYGDGADVLVAFGVPYFGEVIHPSWWRGDDGVASGTAEMPFGVTTIEGLEASIRQRLPAAQPETGQAPPVESSWLVVALIALISAVGLRIVWRRQPQ